MHEDCAGAGEAGSIAAAERGKPCPGRTSTRWRRCPGGSAHAGSRHTRTLARSLACKHACMHACTHASLRKQARTSAHTAPCLPCPPPPQLEAQQIQDAKQAAAREREAAKMRMRRELSSSWNAKEAGGGRGGCAGWCGVWVGGTHTLCTCVGVLAGSPLAPDGPAHTHQPHHTTLSCHCSGADFLSELGQRANHNTNVDAGVQARVAARSPSLFYQISCS